MKRLIAATAIMILLGASTVAALEFKNYGTLGVGGAGVAKPPSGTEGYWNPAALGMNEEQKGFHTSLLVGASSKGNLVDDLDRLSWGIDSRTQPNLANGPDNTLHWDWVHAGMADTIAIDAPLLSIARHPDNVIRAGGGLAIGQKLGRWGVGYYGSVLSTVRSEADVLRILPDEDEIHPMTIAGFNDFGADLPRGPSNSFFSSTQASALEASLISCGISTTAAFNIRNAIDYRFSVSNTSGLKPDEVAGILVTLAQLAASGKGDLIANNQTLVLTNALVLNEVPISYGRRFDFGAYGSVAVGGTAKVMMARLYTSSFRAFMTDIETVYQRLADTYRDSITFGIDAGILWTYDRLAIGVTAKNLNSPRFGRAEGGKLTVRPSVRSGINYEPTEWLRAALDLDLTQSAELTPGLPLQMLGGGIELKPYGWSLFRVGCYKNIASAEPPAMTAGIGYGGESVKVSVDGAYGLGSAAYRGSSYTNEAQLQLSLGVLF